MDSSKIGYPIRVLCQIGALE